MFLQEDQVILVVKSLENSQRHTVENGNHMRAICKGCKSRFFDDNEVEYGLDYCSHCLPRVVNCPVCCVVKVTKRQSELAIRVCDDCRMKYHAFPNRYLILRFKTLERDNFICRYCGRSPITDQSVELHCDHIIPRSKGGEDSLLNFVTACRECNSGKMDVMLDEMMIKKLQMRECA